MYKAQGLLITTRTSYRNRPYSISTMGWAMDLHLLTFNSVTQVYTLQQTRSTIGTTSHVTKIILLENKNILSIQLQVRIWHYDHKSVFFQAWAHFFVICVDIDAEELDSKSSGESHSTLTDSSCVTPPKRKVGRPPKKDKKLKRNGKRETSSFIPKRQFCMYNFRGK